MLEENCELQGYHYVQGQISELIFAPNEGFCVSFPSNTFHNTSSDVKIWNITWILPSFSWDIFSHVTQLDELRGSKNILWLTIENTLPRD